MIPNILHFNFGMSPNFGGKNFSLIHYLCIKSALSVNNPDNAFLWYDYEPDNIWWKKIKQHVTTVKIKAPTYIYEKKLYHTAHRSDVLRLMLLMEYGGIYLDCDIICIKPFKPLLDNKVVMGMQSKRGLCNAVILAEKRADFLCEWNKRYKTFRSRGHDRFWDEHSGVIPRALAAQYPEDITILPDTAFCTPLYDAMQPFFEEDNKLTNKNYVVHLWEQLTWRKLRSLTVKGILEDKSEFGRLMKPYAEELRSEQKRIDYDINQEQV